MTLRKKIVFTVLWISSLFAVGAWAQTFVKPVQPRGQDQSKLHLISESDIAFRVDRTDVDGTPIGALVVKIDGKWIEPAFSPKMKPMAR